MYCRSCGYVLDGLEKDTCPECGRKFSLSDPSSYDAFPGQHRRARRAMLLLWIPAMWPLVPAAWLYLMFATARIVLGRWPNTWGADDPKGIPVVREMGILHGLLLLSMPVPMVILLARGISEVMEANARRNLLPLARAALAAAIWIVSAAILVADPVHAWRWWMD